MMNLAFLLLLQGNISNLVGLFSIDLEWIEKDKLYIQIVETTPYLPPKESEKRKTPFERAYFISNDDNEEPCAFFLLL